MAAGWVSICGASHELGDTDFFSWGTRSGKQLVWIGCSIGLAGFLMMIDDKYFDSLSVLLYVGMLILLIITPFIAKEIKGRDSVSVLGTHIYWQGASNVGYNSFYMSDAGRPNPERISTNAIEHELESYADKYGISCAYSYEGHEFYICSFVGSDKSWCFDRSTGEWHERAERDYSAAVNRRWDVLQTQVFDNRIITGSSKGQVSFIDYENRNQLDGNPIYVERTSPTYCASDNNVIFRELYLDISQGTTPILEGTHANPRIRLSVSLDGGYTFDDYDWRDMGSSGDYVNSTKWHNLGVSRDIVIRIAISSPIKYTINGVRLTVQECRRN